MSNLTLSDVVFVAACIIVLAAAAVIDFMAFARARRRDRIMKRFL